MDVIFADFVVAFPSAKFSVSLCTDLLISRDTAIVTGSQIKSLSGIIDVATRACITMSALTSSTGRYSVPMATIYVANAR